MLTEIRYDGLTLEVSLKLSSTVDHCDTRKPVRSYINFMYANLLYHDVLSMCLSKTGGR